jgi:hypothetical protein
MNASAPVDCRSGPVRCRRAYLIEMGVLLRSLGGMLVVATSAWLGACGGGESPKLTESSKLTEASKLTCRSHAPPTWV